MTMRNLIVFILCLPIMSWSQCYELVWSDEFNTGQQPNPTYWTYDLGVGSSGWGNNEIQVYTNDSENVRIEGGNLVIDAVRKSGNNWTSARIKSQGRFNFTYGRIEFRAKLPVGSGTWPALWMLGENFATVGWPSCGEIDVMEHVGKDPGLVHSALHSPSSYGNTFTKGSKSVPDFANEFHLYQAEWTEERITFSIDGVDFYTYNPDSKTASTWPFDTPFFIIMNIAMGGNWGSDSRYEVGGQRNGVDPNLDKATMEVDYVRVYQTSTNLEISGPDLIRPDEENLTYTASSPLQGQYNCSVPEGATIISGQGTSEITVNWGSTPGEVTLQIVGNCGTYDRSFSVALQSIPQGDFFVLDDFTDEETNNLAIHAGTGNVITLTEQDDQLRIDYDISRPSANPNVVITFDQPVNAEELSELQLRIRTRNESGTISLRADPFDRNGTEKNATPVFRLEPIQSDGDWAWYTFDFQNNWTSNSPVAGAQLDATAIQGIKLYVNYGFFGRPGSDSLWIDKVQLARPGFTTSAEFIREEVKFSVFPNPASDSIVIENDEVGLKGVVQIFNTLGQMVIEQPWEGQQKQLKINTTQWEKGTYRIVWKNKVQIGVRSIVVIGS